MAIAKKIHTTSEKKPLHYSKKMQQALASLALEGIALPEGSLKEIALLDSGEMSKEEFIKKTLAIAKS